MSGRIQSRALGREASAHHVPYSGVLTVGPYTPYSRYMYSNRMCDDAPL